MGRVKEARQKQLAIARDGKVVTFGEVLDLLPERFYMRDVREALEKLNVSLDRRRARNPYEDPSLSINLLFTLNAQFSGLIRQVFDKSGSVWLHMGFEKIETPKKEA